MSMKISFLLVYLKFLITFVEIMQDKLIIKEVTTKENLGDFVHLPWQIYKGDSNWVPPLIGDRMKYLNRDKNPFFEHSDVKLFIAKHGHYNKGRIAAVVDHKYNDFHEEKTGYFGFFESVNDTAVSKMLFEKAMEWLRAQGMNRVLGPMNLSTNNECGLLVDGFDSPPAVMMTYNPRYYIDLYEDFGLEKAKDLYAYLIDEQEIPEKLGKVVERLKKRQKFSVRTIDLSQFDKEVAEIKYIYNKSWEKNWGFVPFTDKEFDYLAHDLKQIVDENLVFIAEVEGKPAGFSLAIPDANQALIHINGRLFPFGIFKLLWHKRDINRLRVITMGVIEEYRRSGIDLVFYHKTFVNGIEKGYTSAELSWVLEDNTLMNRAAKDLNAKIYKTYRIYQYELS